MCHGVKQNATRRSVEHRTRALVYILGGQRIDHKRKKGWWRGLGDMWKGKRIEKGSRERIEIESKETELTIRNIDTCLCSLFTLPQGTTFLLRFS